MIYLDCVPYYLTKQNRIMKTYKGLSDGIDKERQEAH